MLSYSDLEKDLFTNYFSLDYCSIFFSDQTVSLSPTSKWCSILRCYWSFFWLQVIYQKCSPMSHFMDPQVGPFNHSHLELKSKGHRVSSIRITWLEKMASFKTHFSTNFSILFVSFSFLFSVLYSIYFSLLLFFSSVVFLLSSVVYLLLSFYCFVLRHLSSSLMSLF